MQLSCWCAAAYSYGVKNNYSANVMLILFLTSYYAAYYASLTTSLYVPLSPPRKPSLSPRKPWSSPVWKPLWCRVYFLTIASVPPITNTHTHCSCHKPLWHDDSQWFSASLSTHSGTVQTATPVWEWVKTQTTATPASTILAGLCSPSSDWRLRTSGKTSWHWWVPEWMFPLTLL